MHGHQALTICSPQIGIDPESNLGGAVYDREILKALAGLGVRVIIPLPRGEPHESVANWEIVETPRHRWKFYEYNLVFRRAAARLLAKGSGIQILRAHSVHSTGWGLVGLARRHGVRSHLHYHHWEPHWLRNWIERRTMGRYDLVTTDSEYSHRDLVARYGLRNRVEVIYPGVAGNCSPGQASEDLRARFREKRVLLFVGVLIERKNLSFLLRVFRRLRDEGRSDLTLVVVGTGPLEESLRDEAQELGIAGAVEFTGRVGTRAQVEDYYRLCDVFVFPSLVEGFGMAAAEAMASGKPVVASNTTSIPEVVEDGRTGFLANPTAEHDFSDKIARLLDSRDLREEMGRAGQRRVAEHFDFRRSAERLLAIYEQLVGNE